MTTPPELPSPIPDYSPPPAPHDPYAAIRIPDYRRYFTGNVFSLFGAQMTTFTVGYELYERTGSPLLLGFVGLVQVIPVIAMALPVGHLLDRLNRKTLILRASAIQVFLFLFLGLSSRYAPYLTLPTWLHALGDAHVPILFFILLLNGACRAVNQPAKQSLVPLLVPAEHLSNAITWNSGLFEVTNIVGPAIAGIIVASIIGPNHRDTWAYAVIYWINALFQLINWLTMWNINLVHKPRPGGPMTLHSMLAGVRFVFNNKVILGAITLDMFAVLLGGATMMLPVFAKQVIHPVEFLTFLNDKTASSATATSAAIAATSIGPVGLSWLRAAASVGSISMALILTHRRPMQRAGRNLLIAVIGFGLATIVFGLSRNFWLSLVALFFTGFFDSISVVVRHSLVQLNTPDEMRGRVSAVNSVFISSSNELGEFESGVTTSLATWLLRGPWGAASAAIWGPMIAVSAGGVGTVLVVIIAAGLWPQLRKVGRLNESSTPT